MKTALAALGVLTADIYRMLGSVNRGHMKTECKILSEVT